MLLSSFMIWSTATWKSFEYADTVGGWAASNNKARISSSKYNYVQQGFIKLIMIFFFFKIKKSKKLKWSSSLTSWVWHIMPQRQNPSCLSSSGALKSLSQIGSWAVRVTSLVSKNWILKSTLVTPWHVVVFVIQTHPDRFLREEKRLGIWQHPAPVGYLLIHKVMMNNTPFKFQHDV